MMLKLKWNHGLEYLIKCKLKNLNMKVILNNCYLQMMNFLKVFIMNNQPLVMKQLIMIRLILKKVRLQALMKIEI